VNENKVFVEKFCSICGKISWDSESGDYNETHQVRSRTVPCNDKGTQFETTPEGIITAYFADGRVEKYDIDGKSMEV
jgi:hypothetical protein